MLFISFAHGASLARKMVVGSAVRRVEVLRQRHVRHGAVDDLGPLVHEDHVGRAVLLVESAVDDVPVPGTEAEFELGDERLERSLGRVRDEQLRLVGRHVVAPRDVLDQMAVVVPGAGQVVLVRRCGGSRPPPRSARPSTSP